MKTQISLLAIVAILVCGSALAASPAASDPWSKVPALPTACYSSQDHWWEQNSTAIDAVNKDLVRQSAINEAIQKKADAMASDDPMALAQRMQQAMMNDPQNAQKYMQQAMQKGQQATTTVPAQDDKEKTLEAESASVMKQYKVALDKALVPSNARSDALGKKLAAMGFSGEGEAEYPPWAIAESNAILKDHDRAYAANCAQWWSATGPIHAYMQRYKNYLVSERIPSRKKLGDESALENYKMLNVSSEGWRTTTDYEAAVDYMKVASKLFDKRDQAPQCGPGNNCNQQ